MSHEIKSVTCKVCGETKPRVRYGKFGGRTPRWVGADGKLWNGLVCGVCHNNRNKVRMFNKRNMPRGSSET